jgi:hypothetical protein
MMSVMNLLGKFSGTPSMQSLQRWNFGSALICVVQAVVLLALSDSKTYPINTSYQTIDTLQTSVAGSPVLATATKHLFDLNMAYLVAAFLLLAAAAHISMAIWYRVRYEADLANGLNRMRWLEYCLTSGLMLVGVAVIAGIHDVATLGLVFFLGAIVSLLKMLMEINNPPRVRGNKVRYGVLAVALIAGAAAWLAVVGSLLASNIFGTGSLPGYVYWITVALFVAFSAQASILVLQMKKTGPWRQYLHAERSYIILGLISKTALAWLIFASVLKA